MDVLLEILKAILFGIVEGITEWLPISSTGHMILLQQFVQMDVSEDFWEVFYVVIQLGAILAVIGLYFRKLNPFSTVKSPGERRQTWSIWGKIVVGTIPAGIVGLLLNDWAEAHLNNALVVSVALIVYGIAFIVIETYNARRTPVAGKHSKGAVAAQQAAVADTAASGTMAVGLDASSAFAKVNDFSQLSYGRALLIGCFQSLAVVPGTSRSGAIIIGSMLAGTSRSLATEFAFFLAIPVMLGWSVLKVLKHGFDYTTTEWAILGVGCAVALIVSWLAIKFLVGYVKKHDFRFFGWYRIVLGVIVIAFFAASGTLLTII